MLKPALPDDLIWQEDMSSLYFEASTLLFSIFFIHPMLDAQEALQELQRAHEALQIRLRPWIQHYIWDSEPPQVGIVERGGVHYIYGELVFGDSIEDQWLLTHILFEFSKTFPDIYIHMHDNEGEYLLIESHEQLPGWLGPGNDSNRDWINHGRVLIIPQEYYQDRGLRLAEALKFLERAVYRCATISEVDDHIKGKLASYPTKALELQCEIEVSIPRRIAGLIMKKNVLNSAVLKYGKDNAVLEDIKDITEETVDLKVNTTVMAYLFIDYYLKSHELIDFKKDGGKLVTAAIENLDSQFSSESELPTDEEIDEYNKQGDVLQEELIRLLRIPKHVNPKLSFEPPEDGDFKEDDLMDKLKGFFRDTEAGLDGVENKRKQKVNSNAKIDELATSDEEEEFEDDDEKAREFLAKNGLDIDEDDFFEFFAKQALKLSDEDLEKFRNMEIAEPSNSAEEESEEDDNINDDESEMSPEDLKSLAEMLRGLQGGDGPASAFLNNLNG